MEAEIPNLPMTFDGGMQNGQRVQFQDRAFAQFFMHPELRKKESQDKGRPVYESVPYIKIMQPGEKDTRVRRVCNEDKYRFARQWQAFESQQKQEVDGTPLSILFPHNPGAVKTLDTMNITTIEQLANLQHTQVQNIGLGGLEWNQMAKRYLEQSEKGKGFHTMQTELDGLKAENSRLADLVEKLTARVNASDDDDEQPRRGRRTAKKETE